MPRASGARDAPVSPAPACATMSGQPRPLAATGRSSRQQRATTAGIDRLATPETQHHEVARRHMPCACRKQLRAVLDQQGPGGSRQFLPAPHVIRHAQEVRSDDCRNATACESGRRSGTIHEWAITFMVHEHRLATPQLDRGHQVRTGVGRHQYSTATIGARLGNRGPNSQRQRLRATAQVLARITRDPERLADQQRRIRRARNRLTDRSYCSEPVQAGTSNR